MKIYTVGEKYLCACSFSFFGCLYILDLALVFMFLYIFSSGIRYICITLQWKKLIARLDLLSAALRKPDLWDDPTYASRISREHGELLNRIKDVNSYEQELIEHVDLIKLAREENDEELELVGSLREMHIFFLIILLLLFEPLHVFFGVLNDFVIDIVVAGIEVITSN